MKKRHLCFLVCVALFGSTAGCDVIGAAGASEALNARDLLEEIKSETFGDLYSSFASHLESEGFDDQDIDLAWIRALRRFTDLSQGSHAGRGMRGRGPGRAPALEGPRPPSPPGAPRYSDDRSSTERLDRELGLGNIGPDLSEIDRVADAWTEGDPKFEKKMKEAAQRWLTHNDDGKKNALGRFLTETDSVMTKTREDLQSEALSWFKLDCDTLSTEEAPAKNNEGKGR